ncbi:Uncharacterised protein [Salmonella enterica subsp. enterica]|uniref:Uncharacterized protein n=1 Tax=Salmonella enterica I TaxID=59201 RepID=A0A3S4IQ94_SALET|nr:Uncharacterised protein [Salmonella enterica subsp. enterica]
MTAGKARVSTIPPSCCVKTSPDSHSGPATTVSTHGPFSSARPSAASAENTVIATVHRRAHQIVKTRIYQHGNGGFPSCFTLRTCVTSTPDCATRKRPGFDLKFDRMSQMAGDLLARRVPQTIVMARINGLFSLHDKVSRVRRLPKSRPNPDHIPAPGEPSRRKPAPDDHNRRRNQCAYGYRQVSVRYFCITASAAGRSLCQMPCLLFSPPVLVFWLCP